MVRDDQLSILFNAETPAFVYDLSSIENSLRSLEELTGSSSCLCLYSVKACSQVDVLKTINQFVDGFSCSSPFEYNLVAGLERPNMLQVVSPSISASFLNNMNTVPDLLTFNSISQFERNFSLVDFETSLGIRANPKTSFVKSGKYDPCRKGSKLGVTIDAIILALKAKKKLRRVIQGLHIHNNCESEDFQELKKTVDQVTPLLNEHSFKWINLGGGYQFAGVDPNPLIETIEKLKQEYSLKVLIEPGNSIVRDAGFLVSSIIDIFESDGKQVAILDTAVSHAPEVFEYDWSPPVSGSNSKGEFSYIMAGCSCLAGDVFGEYSFEKPKKIGDKVVFEEMGAYTTVKASWFNGINMPNIYVLTQDGELALRKRYTFEDFARHCGVD